MKTLAVTTLLLGCSVLSIQAAPIGCDSLSNLQQYIDQSALGGCFVQDKLFTNFTYSGGGSQAASNVQVTATLSELPGIDVHGFTFVPQRVWTSGFTLGYTTTVMNPASGTMIVAALDQINLGPVVNAATATSTKSNGVVYDLGQGPGVTQTSSFPGVTSLGSSTTVSVPSGSFVISLGEQYTQQLGNVPEPATFGLIGAGLIGLMLVRRKRA